MDAVFKHFNMCEDVSNMIATKVHDGYQKEVNNHISVMVAWNKDYDYWKIFGERVGSSFLLDRGDRYRHDDRNDKVEPVKRFTTDKDREWLAKKLDVIALFDRDYCTKKTSTKLPNEQYMKYIFSGKRIFALDGITRFYHLLSFICDKEKFYTSRNFVNVNPLVRIYFYNLASLQTRSVEAQANIQRIRWNFQLARTRFMQDCFNIARSQVSEMMEMLRKHDKTYHKLDDQNFLDDPVMHRIYYPHSKKITKKGLHAYLTQNGEKRKLTHKSKKELWKMVIGLK